MYGFRVAHITISMITHHIRDSALACFVKEPMPCLETPDEWKSIAKQPISVAVDGKHIAVQCRRCGSFFYYIYYHSLFPMALV
ncbi:hypothetical protein DPMN_187405 [Dreissena polymorpha]|uniref:Uncharacterized protein n=1 Tax=Dreissena polymorpha TaxID=45954 RepID=A0A9D4DS20_DREPO|nr:hypothetical protein DPMN_187405 [Dreissena polymorpha]